MGISSVLKDEIEAGWNAAAATWDPEALTGLYTKDAIFFGLLPKFYVGRSEIHEYFSSYVDVLKGVSLELVEQEVRPLSPEAFVAQGFGHLKNYRKDGNLLENRVRTTLVVRRVGERWMISLHHFSNVPDDAEKDQSSASQAVSTPA